MIVSHHKDMERNSNNLRVYMHRHSHGYRPSNRSGLSRRYGIPRESLDSSSSALRSQGNQQAKYHLRDGPLGTRPSQSGRILFVGSCDKPRVSEPLARNRVHEIRSRAGFVGIHFKEFEGADR